MVAQMSSYQYALARKWDSRTSICDGFLRQLGFDTRSAQNLSQLDALDLSDLALPDRVLKDKKKDSSVTLF